MLQERLARAPRTARLTVRLAQSADEVRQAQKLRYRIFGEEMGARLASAEMGIDCDDYDELCDHLIVLNQASGEVIGTYRMLSPDNARRAPQLYSEHEFDLSRLTHVRDRLVEVGRSCVHTITARAAPSPCCGRAWPSMCANRMPNTWPAAPASA